MRQTNRAALNQNALPRAPEEAHMEFSKQVVLRFMWIVALHIVATLLVTAFQPESAQATVA